MSLRIADQLRNVSRAAISLVAFALLAPGLATPADTVSWSDAEQCIGRVCAVRGTVVDVRDDGTAIRLYFDREKRDVCVTLVRSWLVSWPNYAGREIVASGLVRRFRDVTEVTVLDPDEIALPGAAEPTPPIEFESPAQEEVEDLREEIKRLEQRVKDLEGR